MDKTSDQKESIKCAWCDKIIEDDKGIYHPFWYHLNGHVYCNEDCANGYLSTK